MALGQETKRKIIELYFTQHKNIREIAREVQISSRDVVATVKEHKQELQQSQPGMSAGDGVAQQTKASIEPPVSVKAYELFLTNLALAHRMRASQVVQLLKMANSPRDGMYNIEENIKKYRCAIARLREARRKQGIEMYDLDNKIRSANDILKQLNLVIEMRKKELAEILDKQVKYKLMAEQFMANNNKMYTKIQTIAKDKVNAFLTEYKGRKLLEFALAAVVESLRQRQDPYRELLLKNMSSIKNYDYDPEKVFYLNSNDFSYSNVAEKVLGPSSEIYNKLVAGVTDLTMSTTAGLERYSYPNNTNFA